MAQPMAPTGPFGRAGFHNHVDSCQAESPR